ncbi:Uncharacterised protein [Burkholderia pseudomallei]|nr:Uncharacterised protein [Burkholderia pseudomallei]
MATMNVSDGLHGYHHRIVREAFAVLRSRKMLPTLHETKEM